jgi:hypothetical protein
MEAASFVERSVTQSTQLLALADLRLVETAVRISSRKIYPFRLHLYSLCIHMYIIYTLSGYKLSSLLTVSKGKNLVVTVVSSWNTPCSASSGGESQDRERNSP